MVRSAFSPLLLQAPTISATAVSDAVTPRARRANEGDDRR
jgi:hypothetical protein